VEVQPDCVEVQWDTGAGSTVPAEWLRPEASKPKAYEGVFRPPSSETGVSSQTPPFWKRTRDGSPVEECDPKALLDPTTYFGVKLNREIARGEGFLDLMLDGLGVRRYCELLLDGGYTWEEIRNHVAGCLFYRWCPSEELLRAVTNREALHEEAGRASTSARRAGEAEPAVVLGGLHGGLGLDAIVPTR
jgi:hypothetical protein